MKTPSDFLTTMTAEGKEFSQYSNKIKGHQYALPMAITFRYLKPGDCVLDWGCGNGHWAYFLIHSQVCVHGYSFDPCPEPLENDTRFYFHPASPQSPVTLPFPNAHFDAVFSVGVLEHVHESGGDQSASLREIFRILRPGGVFLCFHIPNRFSLSEALAYLVNRIKPIRPKRHTKTFTKKTLLEMIEAEGFTTLESGVYNFLPRNSIGTYGSISWFFQIYNILDKVMRLFFPFFCSQIYVIAKKP